MAQSVVPSPLAGEPPVPHVPRQPGAAAQRGEARRRDAALESPDRFQANRLSEFSEAGYRTLLELLPDAVLVHVDGRIVYANRSAAALLGAGDPCELLGHSPLDFVDPADAGVAAERIERLETVGGSVPLLEERYRRLDGQPLEVEVSAAAFTFEGWPAIEYIVRDIGERKASDRARRESESRIRAIFDESSIGMLLLDPQGRCASSNAALQRLLGYSEAELASMSIRDITHPDDVGLTGVALREFFAGRTGAFEMEKRYVRKDGSVLNAHLHISPVRDEEGVVRYSATIMEDVTVRKSLENELREQAERDPLCGLPNRVGFAARLGEALRSPERVAVLYLDLDDFKVVNDTFGHAAGDTVLVEAAQRIGTALRATDLAARLGGDEFGILLSGVTAGEAETVASRILDALRPAIRLDGRLVYVHASIGIALSSPAITADEMMRQADVAMYLAKGQGKGRHQAFEPMMHAEVMRRIALRSELEEAIRKGEFVLHFQPIVSCDRQVMHACEALVRWRHPQRGLLGPLEFIGLAEETGLIIELGAWILDEACSAARRWVDELGDAAPSVSVNISAVQFRHPSFLADVAAAVESTGLPPGRLVLELTESTLVDVEDAPQSLTRLRALGVRVALDDFGTGYSSLAYLTRFPIDILKIDRAFVAALGSGAREDRLAEAIVSLGRDLSLEVVAEGVETEAQLERLSTIGCGWQQGFLVARPMPADELMAMLQEPAWRAEPESAA